jgi:hypothetical protein
MNKYNNPSFANIKISQQGKTMKTAQVCDYNFHNCLKLVKDFPFKGHRDTSVLSSDAIKHLSINTVKMLSSDILGVNFVRHTTCLSFVMTDLTWGGRRAHFTNMW